MVPSKGCVSLLVGRNWMIVTRKKYKVNELQCSTMSIINCPESYACFVGLAWFQIEMPISLNY